jgi:hypothetical protein
MVLAAGCSAENPDNDSTQIAEGATLVYEDTFASDGTFHVISDDQGKVGFSVRAPIGSEAEALATAASVQDSLAGVYRKLHPETETVPEELQVLSDAMAEQQAEFQASGAWRELPEPEAFSEELHDKSQSSFEAAVCKTIYGGSNHWYFLSDCKYRNANSVTTAAVMWGNDYHMDRSFGWNETAYTATHSLSASTWKPTIPPYTFYYTEWGGVYDKARATIKLPSGKYGPLGITAHRWKFIPQ